MSIASLIKNVEDLLDRGEIAAAREQIATSSESPNGREANLRLAQLARRAGLAPLSLRMLHPYVRPTNKTSVTPSAAECVTYAAALIRLGRADEGLALLAKVPETAVADALLFRAHAYFSHWDYAAAVPVLERYLKQLGLSARDRIVGQLNLAAALVYENAHGAEQLLLELIDSTEKSGFMEYHGNALELLAQWNLKRKNYSAAEDALERADAILKSKGARGALFVKKWKAIVAVMKNCGPEALKRLDEVRQEARTLGHAETIRDCDLVEARETRNRELLMKLYFGTPFESFRKRLFLELAIPLDLPEHYDWRRDAGPSSSSQLEKSAIIDLFATPEPLNGYSLRLVSVLLSDFYRNFGIEELHAKVYDGEYFNPTSSPKKLHKLVSTVRTWLRRQKLPVEIPFCDGGYSITFESGYALRVPRHFPVSENEKIRKALATTFGDREFSSAEAATHLHLSERTLRRYLATELADGKVLRFGAGSSVRYLLKAG